VALSFTRRYTPADVTLLSEMDREMDTLSGPAMCCILRRMGTAAIRASCACARSLLVTHDQALAARADAWLELARDATEEPSA